MTGGRALIWAAGFIAIALFGGGCTGSARVHVIPLGGKQISASAPLLQQVHPNECYYWIDGRGRLCISMRWQERSLFGKLFEKEFSLSIVVESPPAQESRDYRIDLRTVRLRSREGLSNARAGSLAGSLAIFEFEQGRLRGAFRFTGRRQTYSVLTGWAGDMNVLYLGEFRAVLDPRRGEAILRETEEGALTREAPDKSAGAPDVSASHAKPTASP